MSKFGPKILCLGKFRAEFQKTIVLFEINTLDFFKNGFFIHTVNFGMGPPKRLGSAFSEGLEVQIWVHLIKYAQV